jgi:dienelactone hydrolase
MFSSRNALVLITTLSLVSWLSAGEEKPASKARDVNTHHLFTPPATKKAWEARAEDLRTQVLFSAGLYPMPEKTPLNPRVTGRIEKEDFIVENVAIETVPGFFLCGNVYRPKGKKGPFPAILNPHGHWNDGRLTNDADVPPAEPAPAKPAKGKGNFLALGANLARQGYVVFAYDMVGYADTIQIPKHREFAKDIHPWLWNVNLNGFQLWNSIRGLDYLVSMTDVDPKRLGVTGASGGGTQTFQICAVDDRVAAAVPVNMVSAYMQGGCLCENAPGMRVGTDNVEIASLFAPKPLLLVCCTGDWTKHVLEEEFPALKKVYDLHGAGDNAAAVRFNYEHNYNKDSREAMYAWFGRWLLNDPNPEHFREKPVDLDVKAMHVWNEATPLPANALKDVELIEKLKDDDQKQLAALHPHDGGSLKKFKKLMVPALKSSLSITDAGETESLEAFGKESSKAVLLVLSGNEKPTETIAALQNYGAQLFVLKLPLVHDTADKLWNDFFTSYNRTATGDRVQSVVNALEALKARNFKQVDLVGVGQGGAWALLARGISGVPGRTAIDAAKFNAGDDSAYVSSLYAPGLRRAGGLTTAAILCAPEALCIFNTGEAFRTDRITQVYNSLGDPIRVEKGRLSGAEIALWLKK